MRPFRPEAIAAGLVVGAVLSGKIGLLVGVLLLFAVTAIWVADA